MSRPIRSARPWLFVAAASTVVLLAQVASAVDCGGSTPCSCGNNVIQSRVLQLGTDPVVTPPTKCANDGLKMPVAGVVLDLHGNTIQSNPPISQSTGLGTGVLILSDNVTVTSTGAAGTIQGFSHGVGSTTTFGTAPIPITTTNNSTISNLKLKKNEKGLVIFGNDNTLNGLVARTNVTHGIKIGDSDTVEGRQNDGNVITNNIAEFNGQKGISVVGCDNVLRNNSVNQNGTEGIKTGNRNTPVDPTNPQCNHDNYANGGSGNCANTSLSCRGQCVIDGFPCIPSTTANQVLACSPDHQCGGGVACCCGDTLINSRTLQVGVDDVITRPRQCAGAGVILGTDNKTLDLGSNDPPNTIKGYSSNGTILTASAGVLINANGVTVKNGQIDSMLVGIQTALGTRTVGSTISQIKLKRNSKRVYLLGDDNVLEDIVAKTNQKQGIRVGDTHNDLEKTNTGNSLSGNTASGNGAAGISLFGCENSLGDNTANSNGAEGIKTSNTTGGTDQCNTDLNGNSGTNNCLAVEPALCKGQCVIDGFACN